MNFQCSTVNFPFYFLSKKQHYWPFYRYVAWTQYMYWFLLWDIFLMKLSIFAVVGLCSSWSVTLLRLFKAFYSLICSVSLKTFFFGLCRLCVIAGNISPIDVITHVPILCEEANIPYIYVPSKEVSLYFPALFRINIVQYIRLVVTCFFRCKFLYCANHAYIFHLSVEILIIFLIDSVVTCFLRSSSHEKEGCNLFVLSTFQSFRIWVLDCCYTGTNFFPLL